MNLTVREALSIEPLDQAKLIAGEKGLDRIIESVNVMEVPDIYDYLSENELLVTTMYPLKDDKLAINNFILNLNRKKLAGLAIKPHRYIDEIPVILINEANRYDFPLLELPMGISFTTIIQPLLTKILELRTNELLQSQKIHKQFLDIVLNGGSFVEISEKLSQLIQRPIIIIDPFKKILGTGLSEIGHNFLDRIIKEDDIGDKYLTIDLTNLNLTEVTDHKFYYKKVKADKTEVILNIWPIMLRDSNLGEIIVWSLNEAKFTEIDYMAIEHVTTICALKMMELKSIHQIEQRMRNELLESLLSDNINDIERAIERMHQFSNTIESPYLIIQIELNISDSRTLSTHEQNMLDEKLYSIRRYIRGLNHNYLYWYKALKLIVYYPLTTKTIDLDRDLLIKELDFICNKIVEEDGKIIISIGFSEIKKDLINFNLAYYQALQSLEIGKIINHANAYSITNYDDLGIFRIISLNSGRETLLKYCDDILGDIIRYDQQNGTELLQSLQVFLENNQNSTKAANSLFVHYNTLRYRIDRIQEIIGGNLEDPNKRLAIEVAIKIHSFLS